MFDFIFKHKCSFCGSYDKYGPSGFDYPIFKEKVIAGGGVRQDVFCHVCRTNDRKRFLDYVIDKHTDIYTGSNTVLHIAPEMPIKKKIMGNTNCKYYDGDLDINKASMMVDVTNMQFDDNMFDYIIINHVLEHVPDENAAMRELIRCLKKTGRIIFSFPVCLNENTFEDDKITSEEDRIRYYGQSDHVRLYGEKDVLERFTKYGLKIDMLRVGSELSSRKIRKMRLSANEIIFIGSPSSSVKARDGII